MGECVEQYAKAAERHLRDAEFLLKNQRNANADQLYGLAAECMIKALWIAHDPRDEQDLKNNKKFRSHMDQGRLLANFQASLEEIRKGNLLSTLPDDCPYDDWSIHQRYCSDDDLKIDNFRKRRRWTIRLCKILRLHKPEKPLE